MRAPVLSPRTFRRLTLVNVVLLVAIIVSGAVVRLTDSGLGCSDWPNCNADSFVSVGSTNEAIEQLNRLFSGAIGIPIALALVGAYLRRPRRRDLVQLGWILFALFWCEAVLGGISVMLELAWVSVMGHFLLAIALVGIALVMHHRAGEPDGPARYVVPRPVVVLARIVYAGTVWVLIAGTLVTAAGPHGGDIDAERLDWPITDAARVHSVSVDVLVALVVALFVLAWRVHAPRPVLMTIGATIAAMSAQAVLGYVQYFNAIPEILVAFHVFGAVLVFGCVQQLQLELRTTAPAIPLPPPTPEPLRSTTPAAASAG
jgi:cytochrome c oxidase assembly protein subunit 15